MQCGIIVSGKPSAISLAQSMQVFFTRVSLTVSPSNGAMSEGRTMSPVANDDAV